MAIVDRQQLTRIENKLDELIEGFEFSIRLARIESLLAELLSQQRLGLTPEQAAEVSGRLAAVVSKLHDLSS